MNLDSDGRCSYLEHRQLELRGSFERRLSVLGQELDSILRFHRPRWAAVEEIFLGKNTQSAFKLGHARGVCLAALARSGCEVRSLATRSVKKSVTGHGGADKAQVSHMIRALLGISEDLPSDTTDALALAWTLGQIVNSEFLLKRGVAL